MSFARLVSPIWRSVALAAMLAVGACSMPGEPGYDGMTARPTPPDLPRAGQSYAHRVMSQAGFSFADVESPKGAPEWSLVLGFMPTDMASDAEAARSRFDAMVIDALAQALREMNVGDHGIRPEPLVLKPLGRDPVTSLRFDVTGGGCGSPDTTCAYAAPVIAEPVRAAGPALMDAADERWWVYSEWFGPAVRSVAAGPVPLFPDLKLWQAVSAILPDWSLIYLAPGTVVYRDEETGQQRFNPWPLLARDGCIYRFGPRGAPIRKEPPAWTRAL